MGTNAAQYLAAFIEQSGADLSTIAYLHQDDAFGNSVFEAFAAEAENVGLEIVERIPYNAFEISNLTTEMAQVDASGADILINTGYYNDGVLVARDALAVQPGIQVLMGVAQRGSIATELIAGGLDPSTPVAAVTSATTADEVTARCRLDELASTPIDSPAVLVIGAVAAIDVRQGEHFHKQNRADLHDFAPLNQR